METANKKQGSTGTGTVDFQGRIINETTSSAVIDFQASPEGCIANILSFTTPVDACRLSLVSNSFSSAAQHDGVWDRFLPADLESVISDESSSLIAASPSKKALYLYLSDHPVIIDHGKMSFQLEKRTGRKCYMIAARGLNILGVSDPERLWDWKTLPDSRFEEVVKLNAICWFEFHGKINTFALSPSTRYNRRPKLCQTSLSGSIHTRETVAPQFARIGRLNIRSDGWLEFKMGEFFNSGIENEEVEMSVIEIKGGLWKHGFFLQGIEVKPQLSNL